MKAQYPKFAALAVAALLASTAATAARAADFGDFEVKTANPKVERHDRNVDRAALSAQEKSIAKLAALLKKYQGTRQEPILLSKLSELQGQMAGIQFRVAHGQAALSNKPLNTTAYKKTLRETVVTLDQLIGKYPGYDEIARAYALRGKCHDELGDKARATADYLKLIHEQPRADETVGAYMALADFAVTANEHARAIVFLKEVEKRPRDSHYPFALRKLAWSYYNLRNIPAALGYAEKNIGYYDVQIAQARKEAGDEPASDGEGMQVAGPSGEEALRESMLMDAVVFHFDGLEQKLPQFAVTEARAYFRKLDAAGGRMFGRMASRYAKLLRSHDHDNDLVAWKDQLVAAEPGLPETLEVVITAYEHQLNRRHYDKLVETARNVVTLYKHAASKSARAKLEALPKAQKLLLDTADSLQQSIVKNPTAEDAGPMSATLASIYDSFTLVVEDNDPRVPRVHFNLAEALFRVKDYEKSAGHYRWVVEHGKWGGPGVALSSVPPPAPGKKGAKAPKAQPVPVVAGVVEASLKAIAARYETLRLRKLVPIELKPRGLPPEDVEVIDPLVTEWVKWIDTHVSKTDDPIEGFAFEAIRTMYVGGQTNEAFKRLKKMALDRPSSKFAIPAASLALDTSITTAKWEETHALAEEFLGVEAWASSEFHKRLFAAASDAYFKTVETLYADKKHEEALKRAETFLGKYSASARLADCLTLAGGASLALGEKARAQAFFTRLIAEAPKSAGVATALRARADFAEERRDFAAASRDLSRYLKMQLGPDGKPLPRPDEPMRRKTLVLAWLSGDSNELRAALADPSLCPAPGRRFEQSDEECDRYDALLRLAGQGMTLPPGVTPIPADDLLDKVKDGHEKNRAAWAAVALTQAKSYSYRDRLYLARKAGEHWDDLEPMSRLTVMPVLIRAVPWAFQLNRVSMSQIAPLRANEKYIQRRVEVMREMENASTKAMKLPWARVRAQVLSEIATLYVQFSKELRAIPVPRGLPPAEVEAYNETIQKISLPFEEKGQEIRLKAFEVASRQMIEGPVFSSIAEPFFAENPSQAAKIRPAAPLPRPLPLDTGLLSRWDRGSPWEKLLDTAATPADPEKEPAQAAMQRWARALKAGRFAEVAFFLQELKEKKLMDPARVGLLRGLSLAAGGAQAEALAELDSVRKDLEPSNRVEVTVTLATYARYALQNDRVKDLAGEDEKVAARVLTPAAPAAEPAKVAARAPAAVEGAKPAKGKAADGKPADGKPAPKGVAQTRAKTLRVTKK